jgi:hypothetical protein
MLKSKREGSENLRKKRVEGHTLAMDSKKIGPSRSTFSSTQSSLTYTGPNTTVQIRFKARETHLWTEVPCQAAISADFAYSFVTLQRKGKAERCPLISRWGESVWDLGWEKGASWGEYEATDCSPSSQFMRTEEEKAEVARERTGRGVAIARRSVRC